ncbi:UNVERIFIED_CONTAM: Tyrosine-protein phosphatase non-receptor type 1 [Gekko kuhli]
MVWEQKSRGVVMLNRVMEKGSEDWSEVICALLNGRFQFYMNMSSETDLKREKCSNHTLSRSSLSHPPPFTRSPLPIKCAQYWPQKEEKEMLFEDTNLKLILMSEDIKSYYTVRQLELENLTTNETREILHFHYTTWPDFGVPESPASFLNFLFKVRESGSLSPEHGPVVVHCSAGIGRSGTFCLVDTCLLLMDKRKDPSSVDIKQVLLEMRKYRMGLIQTADQLRFSYLAVIEGAKFIMGDSSVQEQWKELSNEDLDPPPEHTPPPPRPPKRSLEMNNGRVPEPVLPKHRVTEEEEVKCTVADIQEKMPDGAQLDAESTSQDTELRKRTVDASPHTEELVKPEEEEEEDENMVATWKPFLVNICVFTVLTAGAYLCYRACFH